MTRLEIPLRTAPGQNAREHWAATHRRVSKEKSAVGWYLCKVKSKPKVPCVVRLTRHSPGTRPLDDDNLRGSLKAVRDAVATWLKVDDGNPLVRYEYDQQANAIEWAVVIEFQP